MVQSLWKTLWRFLKKLKIELPYDSAIPLLSIYPKEFKAGSQRDICTPMLIAALFTIAKRWKKPLCPSTWMDKEKVVYTHNGMLYRLKKEGNPGTSLVVQWVRLHVPCAGGPGSIPGGGTRSCMHAATKSRHAATKSRHATAKDPACCN